MSQNQALRDRWVAQVLGVDVSGKDVVVPVSAPILPVWQRLKTRLDSQVNALAQAIRNKNHHLSPFLADKGIHAFTQRLVVPLTASLIDFDRSTGPGGAARRAKLLTTLAGIERAVAANRTIALIENNPFGAQVSISECLRELHREVAARSAV